MEDRLERAVHGVASEVARHTTVVEVKDDVPVLVVRWFLAGYNRGTDHRVYLYLPNADSPNLVLLLEGRTLVREQAVDRIRVYYLFGIDHDPYRGHSGVLGRGCCYERLNRGGTSD